MSSPDFLAGSAAVPAPPGVDSSPSSALSRHASGAAALVHEFWRRMASNDFVSVGELLAEDFVLDWPQSGERFRGAERFVRMNQEYPANGPWRFRVHRVVGGAHDAVSDVGVTDGVQQARVISFFDCDLAAGRVRRLVEFWPEPYPAPANRAHLAEPIDDAEGEGG